MKKLLICLLILLGPQILAKEDKIDASDLIDAAIKKAIENNELKRKHLQFTKLETKRNLNTPDANPEVKASRWGVKIRNEDLKITPQDISSKTHEFYFNDSFPYYTVDGYGRKIYEINFKPRAGLPPAKNAYLEVANRSSGTMWLDGENLYVLKIVGHMPDDLSKAFSAGFGFGNIKWVKYEINQSKRTDLNNIIVINSIKVQIRYRIWFFRAIHRFEEYGYQYSDYVYVSAQKADFKK